VAESILEAVQRLADFVAAAKLQVAVIGGVAIVARVRPRTTQDIDILIAAGVDDGETLLRQAVEHGYAYDEDETREFLPGGLIRLWGPPSRELGVGLDVLFADSPFLRKVIARATLVDLGAGTLPIATAEDLLILKLEAHRLEDLDDIIAIKDGLGDMLDLAYVQEELKTLGLLDRYRLYFGSPR
jgi:hypothetical protein